MQVHGPVETGTSLPYGSARAGGAEAARLLDEFEYLEEEFFVSGHANVYGPGQPDAALDGLARDGHGNALGGIRTPWVDVPDARYVARISPGDPLSPGMKRFSEQQMKALYGTRQGYERRIKAKLDDMIEQRWLLGRDVPVMMAQCGTRG